MFLECASCGKMYRVREGTVSAPTKCPACGGVLKASGAAPAAPAAPAGPDPRLKELEQKVSVLERDLAAARADAEGAQEGSKRLEAEAAKAREEAQKKTAEAAQKDKRIAELQADVEKAGHQAAQKAQASQLAVLKQKDERIEELETQVAELEESAAAAPSGPSPEAEARIAQLEKDLEESRANIPRIAEELAREKTTYHEALLGKEKEIEDLNAKLHKAELDLVEAAQTGGGGSPDAGASVFRKQLDEKEEELEKLRKKVGGLERLVQDGERLYSKLQQELDKLKASSAPATEGPPADDGKDAEIAALREETGRQKGEIAELQAKLKSQANTARREIQKAETRMRANADGAGVEEARHLAADLDRSLGSVSTQLAALVERVKRLHQSLYKSGEEALPEGARPGTSAAAPAEPEAEAGVSAEEAADVDAIASAEPVEAPELEASGGEALAEAAAEDAGETPVVEEGDDIPTVEEAVALQQARTQAEQGDEDLEMLPEGGGDAGLPQDETLLDMGKMGKALREPAPPPAPLTPPKRPDTKIRPRPSAPPPEEKKGGFFGKLFGKKK
jgi:chromosome segregation ATPase